MFDQYSFISIISLAIVAIVFFIKKKKPPIKSMFICAVLSVLIPAKYVDIIKYSAISDTEILNGYVKSKAKEKVQCEHYQEVCTTTNNVKTCQKYYDHKFDIDWTVRTTAGTVYINRIDQQGLKEPRRFREVVINEPASIENHYKNYLLANEDSLFFHYSSELKRFGKHLPSYPKVYDYYRINRVLYADDEFKSIAQNWNEKLNNTLKKLGRKKQVNLIVVLTQQPPELFYALQAKWKGGKKNDVILVYGIENQRVKWFSSTSFLDGYLNNDMHSKLRVTSLEQPLNNKLLDKAITIIDNHFTRYEMSNEEAQKEAFRMPWYHLLLALLLGQLPSIIMLLHFHLIVIPTRSSRV